MLLSHLPADRVTDSVNLYQKWAIKQDKAEKRSFSAKKPPPLLKFDPNSLPKEIQIQ